MSDQPPTPAEGVVVTHTETGQRYNLLAVEKVQGATTVALVEDVFGDTMVLPLAELEIV